MFETSSEASDTLLITRALGEIQVPCTGGQFGVNNIPVKCKITSSHQHSSFLGCVSSESSGSFGWYSVSIMGVGDGFTQAMVYVQSNNSFTPRRGKVGNTSFVQDGKSQNIISNWDQVKSEYYIDGPRWVNSEEPALFKLNGPYLSSADVNIYWTISKYGNFGGGTILSGDKTPTINAFFHNPDNGGIVRVRVEPVFSPLRGITIEHVVAVN